MAFEELRAVLFDLDGTLVDSEPLWGVSMDRVAGHLGGSLSPEFRAATTGQSVPFSVKLLLDDIGSERGVEETTSLLLSITAEIFAEDLLWQPGAEQLIDQIRAAGIKTALVTNSPRQLVDVALGGLLGGHRFDVTICGDEVTRANPTRSRICWRWICWDCPRRSAWRWRTRRPAPRRRWPPESRCWWCRRRCRCRRVPGRIFAASLLDSTVTELQHIHHEFRRYRRAHGE